MAHTGTAMVRHDKGDNKFRLEVVSRKAQSFRNNGSPIWKSDDTIESFSGCAQLTNYSSSAGDSYAVACVAGYATEALARAAAAAYNEGADLGG